MRTAWVFPGQGSLRTGCLTEAIAGVSGDALVTAAAEVVAEVDAATGRDHVALADAPDAGARTADAQPVILTASLAAAAALRSAGLRPDVVAGHSLGECTAAVVAGALELADGARVVTARGAAMAEACATNPGAMTAVIKLAPEAIDALLADHPEVVLANDNAPGQVVLAGPPAALDALADDVRSAGGRRIALDVEGAFHSPAMAPAVPALRDALDAAQVRDPDVPLVTGVHARVLTTGAEISAALADGVLAPVRWREVLQALAADGVTHLVEVGPGGVLTGLAKRATSGIELRSVATPADAHDLAVELGALAATR